MLALANGRDPLAHRRLRNAESRRQIFLAEALFAEDRFDVERHGADFSQTEGNLASANLRCARIIRRGCVPWPAMAQQHGGMIALPESPEEIELRRLAQLTEQRTMLEHLPRWFKLRGMRQKDVAAALGVSEATVSGWIKGKHGMSVGQLRQIAVLLKAQPGDLLRPPSEAELSPKVEEALALMDALTTAEWDAVMQSARMLAEAKRRNSV